MNKKVFISMLTLCVAFLSGIYILKIFFPQDFVMVIDNQTLLSIGDYIDNHKWLYYLFSGITAYITYFLYLCATCSIKYLNLKQNLITIGVIIITFVINEFNMNIAMHLNIVSMIALPFLFKGSFKAVVIVYSVHGLSQILSLSIRDFPLFLIVNSATSFLMILECYLWLVLFYIIYNFNNFKKEV